MRTSLDLTDTSTGLQGYRKTPYCGTPKTFNKDKGPKDTTFAIVNEIVKYSTDNQKKTKDTVMNLHLRIFISVERIKMKNGLVTPTIIRHRGFSRRQL